LIDFLDMLEAGHVIVGYELSECRYQAVASG
jgi:hypothetical protein